MVNTMISVTNALKGAGIDIKKKDDRDLHDIHANQLFHIVAAGNHPVNADCHQHQRQHINAAVCEKKFQLVNHRIRSFPVQFPKSE